MIQLKDIKSYFKPIQPGVKAGKGNISYNEFAPSSDLVVSGCQVNPNCRPKYGLLQISGMEINHTTIGVGQRQQN